MSDDLTRQDAEALCECGDTGALGLSCIYCRPTPATLTDEEKASIPHLTQLAAADARDVYAAVESILAARAAALIDRAERAERERDEVCGELDRVRESNGPVYHDEVCAYFVMQKDLRAELAALRAAVAGLADQWHDNALKWPYAVWADQNVEHANRLRALLTDEGDNDGQ